MSTPMNANTRGKDPSSLVVTLPRLQHPPQPSLKGETRAGCRRQGRGVRCSISAPGTLGIAGLVTSAPVSSPHPGRWTRRLSPLLWSAVPASTLSPGRFRDETRAWR